MAETNEQICENENPVIDFGTKGLTGWLIKIKLAKTERQAKLVMIIVAIICFALSFYFFYRALN